MDLTKETLYRQAPPKDEVERVGNWNFEKKVALVTGASRGIGYDICKALCRAKAKVYGIGRNKEMLKKLKKEAPEIELIFADINDHAKLKEELDKIEYFDYLVNCAGIALMSEIRNVRMSDYENVLKTNVMSPLFLIQLVTEKMIKHEIKGSIVNISSMSSFESHIGHAMYASSKAALDMITTQTSLEYGKYNIRCNSINPTIVWTDMALQVWKSKEAADSLRAQTPLKRFAEICEVTEPTLFLLSDKASMITGVRLLVDGGLIQTRHTNIEKEGK